MKQGIDLSRFDYVGVDGSLLRWILDKNLKHSSADADLPGFINRTSPKVGLIGGSVATAISHIKAFEAAFPEAEVLWSLTGYQETLHALQQELHKGKIPDLVIVGMGAGLQEKMSQRILVEIQKLNECVLVVTCGGWLDQLQRPNYYPRWAIDKNLRWLVRLSKEPKRLAPRYSLWAIRALMNRSKIREYCKKNNVAT